MSETHVHHQATEHPAAPAKKQAASPEPARDPAQMLAAPETLTSQDVLAGQQQVGNQVIQRALDKGQQGKKPLKANEELPPELTDAIQKKRGGGAALPEAVRGEAKKALGRDFADVKVHTDEESHRLSHAVHARAFTIGKDIFFKRGAFAPATRAGRETIIHELTHVIQQSGKRTNGKLKLGAPDTAQEHEASRMGKHHAAAAGAPAAGAAGAVQRIGEEEEAPLQGQPDPGNAIQRLPEEEEEAPVQGQPEEEEEPLQRQCEEEEEAAVQGQPEEEEEPLQRQGEEEEPIQGQPDPANAIQRADSEEEEAPIQGQPEASAAIQRVLPEEEQAPPAPPPLPPRPAARVAPPLPPRPIPKAPPPPLPPRPAAAPQSGFAAQLQARANAMKGPKQARHLEALEAKRSEAVGTRVSQQYMEDQAAKPAAPLTFGQKAKGFLGKAAGFAGGMIKSKAKGLFSEYTSHFTNPFSSGKKEEGDEKKGSGQAAASAGDSGIGVIMEQYAKVLQENKDLKAKLSKYEESA